MNIALLEDDPVQARMVVGWLQRQGHRCAHSDRGASFVADVRKGDFDLLIIDWELPDMSGLEALRVLRGALNRHVPVLFVTLRDAEADIVTALNAGADDYMVKQISEAEFLARVEALSRRHGGSALRVHAGPYQFDVTEKQATYQDEPVDLTAKDFELAVYLFQNVGRLLSREQLLRDVWGVSGVNTRTVDVHISRIRKRLGIGPERGYRIKTIYQHGYRLEVV